MRPMVRFVLQPTEKGAAANLILKVVPLATETPLLLVPIVLLTILIVMRVAAAILAGPAAHLPIIPFVMAKVPLMTVRPHPAETVPILILPVIVWLSKDMCAEPAIILILFVMVINGVVAAAILYMKTALFAMEMAQRHVIRVPIRAILYAMRM